MWSQSGSICPELRRGEAPSIGVREIREGGEKLLWRGPPALIQVASEEISGLYLVDLQSSRF